MIAAKSNGEYERYEEELQTRNGTGSYDVTAEERAKYERNSRLSEKLQAVVDDAASTEGEKNAARNQLQRLTPEIVEGKFLEKIEREAAQELTGPGTVVQQLLRVCPSAYSSDYP